MIFYCESCEKYWKNQETDVRLLVDWTHCTKEGYTIKDCPDCRGDNSTIRFSDVSTFSEGESVGFYNEIGEEVDPPPDITYNKPCPKCGIVRWEIIIQDDLSYHPASYRMECGNCDFVVLAQFYNLGYKNQFTLWKKNEKNDKEDKGTG